MPEALTESFCERCGTRYEFAAPTQLNTIRKTRGLISGLKNYIMSQDALGDAVGDAIRSEEEALASQQLDAFHDSFSFCINCRQYTCTNCWNDDAGRCRSCVPIAGTDDLLERFEATFHAQHPEIAAAAAETEMAQQELNRRLGLETWPTEDLTIGGGNGHTPVEWPAEEPVLQVAEAAPEYEAAPETEAEPEPVAADLEPLLEPEPEPEPIAAAEPDLQPEPEPQAIVAMVEAETNPPVEAYPPLRVVAWEEDVAFELEPEPMVAAVETEAEAEAAVEPEPEPMVAAVETEAEAEAAVEPEPPAPPEPQVPRPIRPISETIVQIPRPAPQPPVEAPEPMAAEASDETMVARRAQLDLLGLGDPGEGPLGPDRSNVLPYRSSGASVHAAELAARSAAGLPAPGAFWEASAREVAGAMSHVGVQSCGECGLSLSASARFCRRCGTRQARSA
jgi:hypothetical protein